MHIDDMRKRIHITLTFILFLAMFSVLTQYGYATTWLPLPDNRLTWDDHMDMSPSITQTRDGNILFVWDSYLPGAYPDIFCKVYKRLSLSPWSPTERLTTDPHNDQTPSVITTAEGTLWVVWASNRDGNFEIYYKNHSGSWSPDMRLTNHTSTDETPSVMQDKDGDIWVVWSSDREGNPEIFCRIYYGTEWSTTIKLTTNAADDWGPTIMHAADESIWLVWTRDDNLYYKRFLKNPLRLKQDDTHLTQDEYLNWNPSIMQAQDGTIWIAYESDKFGPDKNIFVKNRTIGGQWGEEKITHNNGADVTPSIIQDPNGPIWIAWSSNRLTGNYDIYYKTDSPPQRSHDLAIISVTHNPDTTVIPKGTYVAIEVTLRNQGLNLEKNFSVTAYANSTLIDSEEVPSLIAGQVMSISLWWNTSSTSSGIYTIKAEVNIVQGETSTYDNSLINGTVLVRKPGDADLNEVVDLDDFYLWRENWGKTADQCPPGIYPDFNNNGMVELWDFYVWWKNLA